MMVPSFSVLVNDCLDMPHQFAPGVYDNSEVALTDLEKDILELRYVTFSTPAHRLFTIVAQTR